MRKFDDDTGLRPVEDDPYAELFADCSTPEELLALQREIEEAEAESTLERPASSTGSDS